MQPEVIVEVGGEGGSITLLSERGEDGKPRFRVFTNEAVFDDDDFPERGTPAPPEYADSFPAAAVLLDNYPWTRLTPMAVHPDYLDQTLEEVHKRGGEVAQRRWRLRLGL